MKSMIAGKLFKKEFRQNVFDGVLLEVFQTNGEGTRQGKSRAHISE
jgi:hypothetical protein